jgi:hypothetical protein
MAKVYAVHREWYESYDESGTYSSECVETVFDSEDKAIAYIKSAFKDVHKWALEAYPDNKNLTLYDSELQDIRDGQDVRVMDVCDGCKIMLAVHYRYQSYDVK